MWQKDIERYARLQGISLACAKYFQCTGEHLVAHSAGGSASESNIVAACSFCNLKRHQRKNPPTPETYSKLVEKRLERGGWNTHLLN